MTKTMKIALYVGAVILIYMLYLSMPATPKLINSQIVSIEEDEVFFTGIAVMNFSEYRIDDQTVFHYKEQGETNHKGIVLHDLVQKCIENPRPCNDDLQNNLIITNLGKMLANYCGPTKVCTFKDSDTKGIELYLPGPLLNRGDSAKTMTRFPFTRGGTNTLKAILDANTSSLENTKYPRGYCGKRYIIGFGYPSFEAFTQASDPGKVQIMTANTVDTYVFGVSDENKSQVITACDSFDDITSYTKGNTGRKEFLYDVMDSKIKEYQQTHANSIHKVLYVASAAGATQQAKQPTDTPEITKSEGQSIRFDNFFIRSAHAEEEPTAKPEKLSADVKPGQLGALRVTVETLFGLIDEKLFKNDQIFLRTDITDAYYGSQIIHQNIFAGTSRWDNLFGAKNVMKVQLEEPRLIAKDRYIRHIYVSPDFNYQSKSAIKSGLKIIFDGSNEKIETTGFDAAINKGVDKILEDNLKQITYLAKASTEKIIRGYIKNALIGKEADNYRIDIEFKEP